MTPYTTSVAAGTAPRHRPVHQGKWGVLPAADYTLNNPRIKKYYLCTRGREGRVWAATPEPGVGCTGWRMPSVRHRCSGKVRTTAGASPPASPPFCGRGTKPLLSCGHGVPRGMARRAAAHKAGEHPLIPVASTPPERAQNSTVRPHTRRDDGGNGVAAAPVG